MNTWLTKLALTALTAAALLLPSASTYASGNKFYVDDDKQQCKTAQFSKIQDAIDVARSGDTVYVCSGLYVENLLITRPLTLRSQVSKGQTLPLLQNVADVAPAITVYGGSKDVTIRDLRLVGTPNNTGIDVTNAQHVTLQSLNLSSFDYGIYVHSASDKIVIENSIFTNARIGILLFGNTNIKVSKNTVTATRHYGIRLDVMTNSSVTKNTVIDNQGKGIAIFDDGSKENTKDNTFDGNIIKNSGELDAFDVTVGSKTGGTANTWKNTTCVTSNPAGLCK